MHSIYRVKPPSTIIAEYLYEKGISKTALGKMLNLKQQAISKRLSKKDLDTDFIQQVSDALKHNFFEDLSREYSEHAKRKGFNVSNVVGEPRETYGNTGLEKMLRDLVKDEIKKNK
jgi:hypothetical protein